MPARPMDKLELQSAEFNAVERLVTAYRNLPAIVDDTYPEMRHYYESAVKGVIRAFENNGHAELTASELGVLRMLNVQRAARWHGPDSVPWTGADWSNAMCGEAGEVANAVKKMRRIETGVASRSPNQPADVKAARAMIAKEIGDTVIYLDLLAHHYSIDTYEAVRDAFNGVSEREGFPERL